MIYENGALKEIMLPEGYYQNGTFYYYLKDHPGNNRVTINSSGAIVEKSHYYPSGTRFFTESTNNTLTPLPYRYNGKELEAMNGLNQMDYGARRRFSWGPIWTGVDPLAEKYYDVSPYAFCGGNPVNRIDPNGMDWTITSDIDKDGVSHFHILFTGAVVDETSDQKGQADKLAESITSQFEALFNEDRSNDVNGGFTVDAKAVIRSVDSEDDVAKNETVFKIQDSNSKDLEYNNGKGTSYAAGKELNGKEIAINENAVPDIISGKNKKTVSHEVGHTGGLRHPEDDNTFFRGLLGKP